MGHVGLSILDNVNWRMVRPFSVTVTGAASLRASLKRARIGGSDASRGRFSFSLSRCAPELTLHFFFLCVFRVGVFRSVSELSGQIHHHRNKLAATHSDKLIFGYSSLSKGLSIIMLYRNLFIRAWGFLRAWG